MNSIFIPFKNCNMIKFYRFFHQIIKVIILFWLKSKIHLKKLAVMTIIIIMQINDFINIILSCCSIYNLCKHFLRKHVDSVCYLLKTDLTAVIILLSSSLFLKVNYLLN